MSSSATEKLGAYLKKLEQLKGRRALLSKQLSALQTEQVSLKSNLIAIEEAQAYIQKVAKETQEQLRYHIEDVVQLAIDSVFPDEYEFKVRFEIKRGKTEARLCFLRNGIEIDPLTSAGGGVSDVVSFALRLAVWSLSKTRKVVILDEPFRYLSKDLQSRAGVMLRELSLKLGLQIIMITHEATMMEIGDRRFVVSLVRDGEYRKSVVKVV
jgi:DNA repair exonuclease SbcCD ATPase subunit